MTLDLNDFPGGHMHGTQSSIRHNTRRHVVVLLTLVMAGVACSTSDTTAPPPEAPGEVGAYLTALPPWTSFSPALPDQPATATGAPRALAEDTVDVNRVEENGSVSVIPDVVYSCTETPYSIRTNPTQIVMYSPDKEILWPGSLIQGRSHRDGLGALLGLTIEERTPIRVSIPAIPSGDNFREIERPNQARVAAAIGEMVGNATTANLSTPSTITFEKTESHSERQLALSMRISGHYLGFSARASANFNRNSSETTVTAQFYQKMFEVVVAPPQSPGAFFSADFTQAKLDQQIALQRIGPDNIPVYLSTVVYGRMMMVSMTASATAQEISAALEAAYDGVAGGVNTQLGAKERTLLQTARISVTSLGGNADATLAMIRSGDWSQYFSQNAPLSSAEPISYTFRNLSDGSIASVTEATEYNLKTCQARAASPGSFEFRALVSTPLGIPTPVRTFVGDVTGSGAQDLILNHLGTTNQVRVATADGAGGFTMSAPMTHPASPSEGWANYTAVLGDFNGDGRTDIAWNYLGASTNRIYLGLSNGDGTFGFPSVRIIPGTAWNGWTVRAGDVNGDGADDLMWNALATTNRVRSGISNRTGDFTLTPIQTHPNSGWTPYRAVRGDVNADLRADFIWRAGNRTYFGPSTGTGSYTVATSPLDHTGLGAVANYALLEGDVNGDGRTDVIWADTTQGLNPVATGISTGTALSFRARQNASYNASGPLRVRSGDVNGDGKTDLVFNTIGAANRTYVALGKDDGMFDFTPLSQLHPQGVTDWEQFSMLIADVTGDGRADVIWVHPAPTLRIYVGVARAP